VDSSNPVPGLAYVDVTGVELSESLILALPIIGSKDQNNLLVQWLLDIKRARFD